ncbi:inorganic triphosphatase, partial [Klebsiella pneumoniae]
HLRALLNDADAVLLAADTADEALFRTEVVGAKLALTEWLVQRGWRPFLNEAGEKKIAGSFKRFADIHLSRVAAELRSAVQHLAVEDAADQLPKLSRDIDSVQLLAGAYGDAVAPWLENWQELQRAIEHDDRSVFEYFRRQALAAEPFWLHSGKR